MSIWIQCDACQMQVEATLSRKGRVRWDETEMPVMFDQNGCRTALSICGECREEEAAESA